MKKISIFLALSCLTLLSHATASTPTESVSTPSLTPQSDVGALLVRRFEQNSDTITFTFKNVSQSQPLYDVLPTLNIDGKTQKVKHNCPSELAPLSQCTVLVAHPFTFSHTQQTVLLVKASNLSDPISSTIHFKVPQ